MYTSIYHVWTFLWHLFGESIYSPQTYLKYACNYNIVFVTPGSHLVDPEPLFSSLFNAEPSGYFKPLWVNKGVLCISVVGRDTRNSIQ